MATVTHQPWKPTCWVGGAGFTRQDGSWTVWANNHIQELADLSDDSRAKYAATKATAAILRSMRK